MMGIPGLGDAVALARESVDKLTQIIKRLDRVIVLLEVIAENSALPPSSPYRHSLPKLPPDTSWLSLGKSEE